MLTTALLKQLGVKRVICRATSSVRSRVYLRIGADEVVNPESEAAERWRNRLLVPAILERTVLAKDTSLVQLAAPKNFVGKTLQQLDVRRKYEVNIVAIRRNVEKTDAEGAPRTHQEVLNVPTADTQIEAGDVLILIGADDAIGSLPAN